ncbi:hypothetical protein CHS0354_000194 [Potamilus streckersoni]|uniref:ETS domain-containing protein n=1 Tax=Potamilus streckersoni TaxID=2493646 RepID=A0AAE0SQY6_9BIVA|nr:hypothetical protein CHS0354_000194 [Potamilus streckersoni]
MNFQNISIIKGFLLDLELQPKSDIKKNTSRFPLRKELIRRATFRKNFALLNSSKLPTPLNFHPTTHPVIIKILKVLNLLPHSMEAKGIDSIPTSDILVDIEGYQYLVDPNEDISIDCNSTSIVPTQGSGQQQISDQKGNNGKSFHDHYSTTCRICLSTSRVETNQPEPCFSFSDLPSATNNTGSGKQRTRGCRLWEFIRNLLRDPCFNPSYICWENEEEGKFRIVKSRELARLWGSKKGNTNMTYEKMSRAMRYYYKKKVLAPVLGKRLVYSFGPRANWKL